jgi:hypothetical protein
MINFNIICYELYKNNSLIMLFGDFFFNSKKALKVLIFSLASSRATLATKSLFFF